MRIEATMSAGNLLKYLAPGLKGTNARLSRTRIDRAHGTVKFTWEVDKPTVLAESPEVYVPSGETGPIPMDLRVDPA